jgi:hypothetical protein
MAYAKRHISALDVMVDEVTGAILVGDSDSRLAAFQSAVVDVAANGSQTIVPAPGAGKAIWVYGYELHAGVAPGTFVLASGATPLTGTCPVGVNGGVARDADHPLYRCGDNQALCITTVGCAIDGSVCYRIVTP